MTWATRLFAWLSVRLIGAFALTIVVFQVTQRLLPMMTGELAFNAINAAILVCYALIALIFLIPSMSATRLRRRRRIWSEIGRGLILTGVSAFVLSGCVAAAKKLGVEDPALQGYVIGLALLAFLVFFLTVVFPGPYASYLAGDRPRAQIPQMPGHVQDPGSEARIDAWQARALARHQDRDAQTRTPESDSGKAGGLNPGSILFMLCMVFMVVGGYGGGHAHFIPDAAHMALSLSVQWPIIIGMTLIMATAFAIWPPKKAVAGPIWRFILMVVVGGMCWSFAAVAALPHGLPALHSLIFVGEPSTLRVQVVETGDKRRRRACNHTVYIRAAGAFDSGKRLVCDVPVDIWTMLRPGQTLVLRGERTAYGFRYRSISRR